MQIVAMKFLLIFWIVWFNGNNVKCEVKVLEGDVNDTTISEMAKVMLRNMTESKAVKTTAEVFRWMNDFVCRSELYLYMDFSYSLKYTKTPQIRTVKIQNANGELMEPQTILTDERFVNISNLKANNTYTIKTKDFQLNKNLKNIPEYQLTTLPKEYTPAILTEIKSYVDIINNLKILRISWTQAEGDVCFYNVLIFSPFGEVEVYFDKDVLGYYVTVPNITAINFIEVHVQGINQVHNKQIKGETLRNVFDVSHSKGNIDPERTDILQVMHTHKYGNVFSMNVSWAAPRLNRVLYMLRILDLDRNLKQISARVTLNITTKDNFINLSNVTLNGTKYEVHLIRFTYIGIKNTYYFISRPVPQKSDNPTSHNIVLIVSPVIVILAVALLILIIFHRRSIRKLHEEELAKKIRQELENSLFINDEMEIDRDNVLLLDEVLGEGAFGLVRKGLLKLNDTSECEVAVKMLKADAGIDDIKEFHSEIEVMKLVGEHPNIVRIIGHFTRNASEMLLIAEYCSQGNLLLYLRAEWHYVYRSKFNASSKQEKKCSTVQLLNDNQADTTLNFDKKVVSYENMKDSNRESLDISQTTDPDKILPTQFVVNECYAYGEYGDQLMGSKQSISRKTNKTDCGKSSDKSDLNSRERIIELKSVSEELGELVLPEKHTYYNYPKSGDIVQPISRNQGVKMRTDPLTSGDLLRIAKQAALGMVFLSKNRVVHRDLAARNVLVCEDNTVKISDFGLSRDIYAENMYKKSGNGKLPIKWLALESMSHGLYTTKSDVWSYGILLYEIVTLGGTPYPLVPVDGLLKYLKSGHRMEKPNNCSQALYDLMKSCWSANPTIRPSFTDICQIIDEMLIVTHEK